MVAMSGGVDSSVAAALLVGAGHDVVGATLKLWGGDSDSGCCSVADVEDARRVADRLGINHHVFNFTEDFERTVVDPYVSAHGRGRTPNPCIECNRHVKFGRLLDRARRLGFDALATGHHARVDPGPGPGRRPSLRRGRDAAKDQSYVLSMLDPGQLRDLLLPVGELTKAEVRAHAAGLDLPTATKPDSQDVCFIHSARGRGRFLAERTALHGAELVDATSGEVVGAVPAVELVTVGQRRGLGGPQGQRRYALHVDVAGRRVVVGSAEQARTAEVALEALTGEVAQAPGGECRVLAQSSAHAAAAPGRLSGTQSGRLVFEEPHRPVAPGQTVAFYDPGDPTLVVGSGVVSAQ
jgi:tRNA-specific 2-thiouridylase